MFNITTVCLQMYGLFTLLRSNLETTITLQTTTGGSGRCGPMNHCEDGNDDIAPPNYGDDTPPSTYDDDANHPGIPVGPSKPPSSNRVDLVKRGPYDDSTPTRPDSWRWGELNFVSCTAYTDGAIGNLYADSSFSKLDDCRYTPIRIGDVILWPSRCIPMTCWTFWTCYRGEFDNIPISECFELNPKPKSYTKTPDLLCSGKDGIRTMKVNTGIP
jgi:hypothetical protein